MGSLPPATRWHPRPTYHLKALQGWLNDPCAPGYDAATGTYHLFYQWNPKSCDWGDICWGHFTSKDGIHWSHNGDQPVLQPSRSYDSKGIFTGCFHPTGPHGQKDQLTVIYTSIQSLPIHWSIPYSRNCAGLAMATSGDGGATWQKSPLNPILDGEPHNLTVTGFRDPYLAEWSALDELRGEQSLYGIVSGGVENEGPNALLYAVSPSDLSRWTYIGRLCDMPVTSPGSAHTTYDFGLNWECVNFMTLETQSAKLEFLTMGAEGGFRDSPKGGSAQEVKALWMAGALVQTVDGPKFTHEINGILDCGSFYAAASYQHPEDGTRIVWGWIKEDELTLERRERKGWTGYLSMPRELFLYEKSNVLRTLRTPLEEIPSLLVSKEQNGLKTVRTLGLKPLDNMAVLRNGKPRIWTQLSGLLKERHLLNTSSTSWELEAVIAVKHDLRRVGLHILHDQGMLERTTIAFSPFRETIEVDRTKSNYEPDIVKTPVIGPFTLFISDEDGTEAAEKLRLRVFLDGDVLEVFANDRFALSTTVYANAARCLGVTLFSENLVGDCGVVFESVRLWQGHDDVQRQCHA